MNKSSKSIQIVFLVVLLGGLSFMVFRMFVMINPPPQTKPKVVAGTPATKPATGPPAKKPDTKPSAKPAKGAKNVSIEEPVLKEQYLNPNLFRAFEIKTPRNPFVQKEEWYADFLEENLPGYPELKDSEYFENFDVYMPDIELINGEDHQWKIAQVQRSQDNKYTISGTSQDGRIQTRIVLEEDIPTTSALEWGKGSGVPISDLNDPESAKRFMRRVADEGTFGMGNEDLFNGDTPPAGLGVPGMMEPQGDNITCSGISLGQGRAAALLSINGFPTLVADGSYIPPRFRVLEIKADGVILEEVQDGSSRWIPLGGK